MVLFGLTFTLARYRFGFTINLRFKLGKFVISQTRVINTKGKLRITRSIPYRYADPSKTPVLTDPIVLTAKPVGKVIQPEDM